MRGNKVRIGVTLLLLLALITISGAALAQGDDTVFEAVVDVDSAHVRVLPSPDAERVSSLFENQILEVVGRNLDGLWFEVRRPGRLTNLGWVFHEVLDWDFHPEDLPLTDLATGLVGPVPMGADPGFALYMLSGATLRSGPLLDAARVGSVPRAVTVPVLERNQDGTWLRVNYLGYVGWIVAFTGRDLPEEKLLDIPIAANLPPMETFEVEIIPPELQLAQLERMRTYTRTWHALAANLETFWTLVARGEVMPCNPPPEVTEYQYAASDVRELPEIARYAPQANDGVMYLNASLDTLRICGVLSTSDIQGARADAINARLLFEATLERLDNLEELIIHQ